MPQENIGSTKSLIALSPVELPNSYENTQSLNMESTEKPLVEF